MIATLYADAQGKLLRLVDETGFLTPPANAPNTLELDTETHAAILARLAEGGWSGTRWKLLSGVLTENGVTVPVADSNEQKDRRLLQTIWTALNDTTTTLSQAQIKTIFRLILRRLFKEFKNQ